MSTKDEKSLCKRDGDKIEVNEYSELKDEKNWTISNESDIELDSNNSDIISILNSKT